MIIFTTGNRIALVIEAEILLMLALILCAGWLKAFRFALLSVTPLQQKISAKSPTQRGTPKIYILYFLKMVVAMCPPKPKVLLIAKFISRC